MAIINKSVPAYRIEFFDDLRSELDRRGIRLDLYHGDPVGSEASKGDSSTLPWATFRHNRTLSLGSRDLVWQPILTDVMAYDLVVVEQASKLLVNYPLLAASLLRRGPHIAFWGHGANLQTHTASGAGEWLKRRYSRLPHWWFAYTEGSKDRVTRLGFPADRVTVVQNAVDTDALKRAIEVLHPEDLAAFERRYGLTRGRTALFLSSLYPEKRLDFLVEAGISANRLDPNFCLLIGGDGPSRGEVEAATASLPFVRYLGRLDGREKALALAASDVMLMPGLVGLGILDAFAAGLPLLTTDIGFHSPEIEYLTQDHNGLLLPQETTSQAFGAQVISLLSKPEELARLGENARRASDSLTTAAMVDRFATGIAEAVQRERRR